MGFKIMIAGSVNERFSISQNNMEFVHLLHTIEKQRDFLFFLIYKISFLILCILCTH